MGRGASDAEIVELYLSLGGGKGYVEHLLKGQHFLDVVTPEEILRYEQTYGGKKGEQHRKRLEMLQGLSETMSEEQVYEAYQASVLENHAVKRFVGKVGISQSVGFDETVKAEEVITPQMIFDYENRRLAQLTEKHRERKRPPARRFRITRRRRRHPCHGEQAQLPRRASAENRAGGDCEGKGDPVRSGFCGYLSADDR